MKTHGIAPPKHLSSRIAEVWLELDHYAFHHSYLGQDADDTAGNTDHDDMFIGRYAMKERLKMLLYHSATSSGAYLITGFRGMGKTSLVHKALGELEQEHKDRPFEKINISLSQDDVRDADVLRQIAHQLHVVWDNKVRTGPYQKKIWPALWIMTVAVSLVVMACLACYYLIITSKVNWQEVFPKVQQEWWGNSLSIILILLLLAAAAYFLWRFAKITLPFFTGRQSCTRISKRLHELNTRLDARLTQEKGTTLAPELVNEFPNSDAVFKLRLFDRTRRQTRSFEIASPKEIEKELLDVLQDISEYRIFVKKNRNTWRWPFLYLKQVPEFIFVIDELDKIEPSFFNRDLAGESINQPGEASESDSLLRVRRRQEAVARLLANLKSFLNEAKAKFVFIGGREMYDAALADIADRDSFYSSIFHDIIYVNSFFKDRLKSRSGVTRMTEAYICKLLIPARYVKAFWAHRKGKDPIIFLNSPTRNRPDPLAPEELHQVEDLYQLETLFHYLVDSLLAADRCNFPMTFQPLYKNAGLNALPKGAGHDLQVLKIIFLIQNFIIFLTYRSNGAPKKLAALLERYIEPVREDGKAFRDDNLTVRVHGLFRKYYKKEGPKEGLFLRFKYDQQYEIGLTSNLYRPYVIMHSRYLKALGDKLLYSTAFIMDYLLKFHPFGFSWRNIELIPEAILTNKDPNLRQFIRDLVRFLAQTHIRETLNGMLQYKFFGKVSAEIRYASKISDLSAAAFNFTLDESLHIKNYYLRQLDQLYQRHRDSLSFEKDDGFVHSISFLHINLGELYYFDQEFDKAIIHFTDAMQPLRWRMENAMLTNHQIVLLTRAQLRLGMCLEKIQAFDSAYSIYRSLIIHLPRLLANSKHSTVVDLNEETSSDAEFLNPNENTLDMRPDDKPLRRMQLLVRPHIAILDLVEKQRHDGITFSNLRRNIDSLNDLLDRKRNNPLEKNTARDMPPGMSKIDAIRLNTLYADYYQNVGNILFYKNRNFPELYDRVLLHLYAYLDLPKGLAAFLKQYSAGQNDYNPPLSAFAYYSLSLTEQVKSFEKSLKDDHGPHNLTLSGSCQLDFGKANDLERALWLLHPEVAYLTNSLQLYSLGNLLSKMGDCLLACVNQNSKPFSQDALMLFDSPEGEQVSLTLALLCTYFRKQDKFFDNPLNFALALYRLASLFYLKSGRNYSYVFQYKKLLFVLKDHLLVHGARLKDGNTMDRFFPNAQTGAEFRIEDFLSDCTKKMFQAITWMSESSNRPQVLKYREVLRLERDEYTGTLYNNISTSPETREVMLLVEEIRLKMHRLGLQRFSLHINDVITPYDTIASKFVRMLELRYKAIYNYAWLKQQGLAGWLFHNKRQVDDSLPPLPQQLTEQFDLISALVQDSVYCLFEVIRTLNIYGINYVTNHSYLASAHSKMGDWCQAWKNLIDLKSGSGAKPTLEMPKLFGIEESSLEPNYHYELATRHYHAAIQTHNGGRAYKENVTGMSFLEDDFNDNFAHFCAATERYRINTGSIRKSINDLKTKIEVTTQMHKPENYWENHRPGPDSSDAESA